MLRCDLPVSRYSQSHSFPIGPKFQFCGPFWGYRRRKQRRRVRDIAVPSSVKQNITTFVCTAAQKQETRSKLSTAAILGLASCINALLVVQWARLKGLKSLEQDPFSEHFVSRLSVSTIYLAPVPSLRYTRLADGFHSLSKPRSRTEK